MLELTRRCRQGQRLAASRARSDGKRRRNFGERSRQIGQRHQRRKPILKRQPQRTNLKDSNLPLGPDLRRERRTAATAGWYAFLKEVSLEELRQFIDNRLNLRLAILTM